MLPPHICPIILFYCFIRIPCPQGCIPPSLCYNDRPMVTKRQLGIGVVVFGLIVILSVVAVDLVDAGQWGGFGPLQRIGIGLGLLTVAVGGVLIRLGDRLA